MRTLPRSLAPLPDEALHGYLLRLSYRIDHTPMDLARMAGWQTSGTLSPGLLLDLPRTHAQGLAHLARLTEHEVMTMTLAPMRENYPPIAASLTSPHQRLRTDPWITVPEARYCPTCLAGDGTEIQNRYGGPWKLQWHLPVLFACPQHQRFLQHTCPACGHLAGPRLRVAHRISLRPTQCRLKISRSDALCSQRLDHAEDLHPTPASALIDLHTRLEELIRSADPHHARQSLSDLRMIVPLLYFSWPQSKGLMRTELHDTAAAFLKSCWWASPTPRRAKVRYDTVDRLPPDAPASAAFLDAADRLLRSGDLQDRLADLLHAAFGSETGSTNWTRAYHKRRTTLSSRLRAAADPLLQAARRSPGPPRQRAVRRTMMLTSTGATSYGPHHIPASLRDQWITDEFRKLTAPQISLRLLRRTAAARLVQLSADCSLWEAAQWLGIRPRAIQVTTADDTPRWQRSHPQHAHAFTAAVDHLVHHLDPANERIDYRHRRETLRDWWIPASIWEELTAQMPRRGAPDLGRLKCQTASVFVWTTITQGDVLLAPRPLDADVSRPRPVGWSNQRNQFWDHLAHSKHLKHYVDLRQALTKYAAHRAQEIDSRSTA